MTVEAPTKSLDTDVCIVGGGAAGLSIADALAGEPYRVLVVEGGGAAPNPSLDAISAAENAGLPYDQLEDARARSLGGNSRLWFLDVAGRPGLRLRSLDPVDLEPKPWVTQSGWPISWNSLEPFDRAARRFFGLGAQLSDDASGSPLGSESLFRPARWEYSPSARVHDDAVERIRSASNTCILTGAHVTSLVVADGGAGVTGVRARRGPADEMSLDDGGGSVGIGADPWVEVNAKVVVLAAGAVEAARLVLLAQRDHPRWIQGEDGPVGRYFMEHPHFELGSCRYRTGALATWARAAAPEYRDGHQTELQLVTSSSARRTSPILGMAIEFLLDDTSPGLAASSLIRRSVRTRRRPGHLGARLGDLVTDVPTVARVHWQRARRGSADASLLRHDAPTFVRLQAMSEQVPNPDSRVTLSDRLDAFGIPMPRLRWVVSRPDLESIRALGHRLSADVRRATGTKLRLESIDWITESMRGGWHHMGTMRMSDSPRVGVVDSNCRVHGVANLFVAGSAVFPTSGFANPTLSLVAVSLRLADHLKHEMRGTPTVSGDR